MNKQTAEYTNRIERIETIIAGELMSGKLRRREAHNRRIFLNRLQTETLDDLLHDLREEEQNAVLNR
jgi:hypothetical protein